MKANGGYLQYGFDGQYIRRLDDFTTFGSRNPTRLCGRHRAEIHRTSMIGLLAAVAAIVLGVGIYRVFFFRPVDAREIGWVLEVTGDGWSLKSDSSRLLKVGDRLPAGGILVPKSKDSKTTITICDFEGNPNFYVGTDGSQVLPAATLNNLATKLWQRVADRYDSKDIHAISRGDDDLHLHSGIGVQSAEGPVDLSTVLMNLPKSTYVLQFKGIGTRLSPTPTASAGMQNCLGP